MVAISKDTCDYGDKCKYMHMTQYNHGDNKFFKLDCKFEKHGKCTNCVDINSEKFFDHLVNYHRASITNFINQPYCPEQWRNILISKLEANNSTKGTKTIKVKIPKIKTPETPSFAEIAADKKIITIEDDKTKFAINNLSNIKIGDVINKQFVKFIKIESEPSNIAIYNDHLQANIKRIDELFATTWGELLRQLENAKMATPRTLVTMNCDTHKNWADMGDAENEMISPPPSVNRESSSNAPLEL